MDFKKLAEQRRNELLQGCKTIEEFYEMLNEKFKTAWYEKQQAIEEDELQEAHNKFRDLMRSWRNDVVKAEKIFKTNTLVKMEALALGFSNSSFNNDDSYKEFKALCIKTAGSNKGTNGKEYQVGQFKTYFDYQNFKEFVIDFYEDLQNIEPSLMEVLS